MDASSLTGSIYSVGAAAGSRWVMVDALVDRGHLLQVLLGLLELLARLSVGRLAEVLNSTLEVLIVGLPFHVVLLHAVHRLFGGRVNDGHRLGRLAAAASRSRGLALSSHLGLVLDNSAPLRSRNGTVAMVIVDTPHVILEVPGPRESLTLERSLTSLVSAVVSLMAMHPMGLALMAEQAGGGGEARISAGLDLAAVGPKVGVDELAVRGEGFGISLCFSGEDGARDETVSYS